MNIQYTHYMYKRESIQESLQRKSTALLNLNSTALANRINSGIERILDSAQKRSRVCRRARDDVYIGTLG